MNQILPLAVVGCGAISDSYYFPALATLPAVREHTWLVEPDLERGRDSASRYGFRPEQLVGSVEALRHRSGPRSTPLPAICTSQQRGP